MADIKYKFAGGEYANGGELPLVAKPVGRFSVERMKAALASSSVLVPAGLTREQLRAFILEHAHQSK